MDLSMVKNIVEAALFAAGRPMSMNELLRLFSEDERPERKEMRDVINELTEEYDNRGIELIEVASGYRVQVRHQMGEWLGRLSERRPPRYSRALMETLALVAYRQPITRGDIEEVRGVSVSTNIIRTLLERGWVRIVGHRDVPGRPAMFGTTKEFLDYFNLKTLDELPSLAELTDVDSLNAELDFGDTPYDDLEDEDGTSSESIPEKVSESEQANEPSSDDEDPKEADDQDESETISQDKLDSDDKSDNDNDIEIENRADDEGHDDDLDEDEDFEGWDVDDEDEEDSESDDELESLSA